MSNTSLQDAPPKATRAKWRERLQRGLLKVWIGGSALWIACILAMLGQCVYGPWIGWQQPQCAGPLANAAETYLADIAIALGPPAAVILLYRVVMWWARRVNRRREPRVFPSKAESPNLDPQRRPHAEERA